MFKNLEAEIVRSGMSKKEFARKINVANRTIYDKLSGKSEFTLSEVQAIKKIFPRCSMEYLFEESA